MKKIKAIALIAALCVSALSAYNPPVGAESMYELSSPTSLSGQSSVAGGGIYKVGPESLNVNPALTATEQRVVLNLAYTALIDGAENTANPFGSAFQTGILIPTKLYIYSIYLNGTFVPFETMDLENSFTGKLGMSKSITDKIDVGIGINTGVGWGVATDWALGANIGMVGKPGNVLFMKDFRYGVSVLNLGKNYKTCSNNGTAAPDENGDVLPVTAYPTIATLRGGCAASLIKNDVVNLGFNFDITTPGFQNLIFDAGLNLCLKEVFTVGLSEKINLVESIRGYNNFIPAVGVNFKFVFDIKNKAPAADSDEEIKENKFASYMEKKEWSQSEMTVSGAYKNLYESVNAISAGVDINLGLKDNTPPEIIFVFDDEE